MEAELEENIGEFSEWETFSTKYLIISEFAFIYVQSSRLYTH